MADATNVTDGLVIQLGSLIAGMNVYLHLYTNDPPITPTLQKTDLVEVAFWGYAPVRMNKWTPPTLQGGVAFALADGAWFHWENGPVPDPVQGFYLTNGEDGELIAAWRRPGDAYPLGPDHPNLIVNVKLLFPPVAPT